MNYNQRIIYLISIILFRFSSCLGQTTFYVSSNGSNSNSGLTPKDPIKTIEVLKTNSKYLLKSGDTLYFDLKRLNNNSDKITIASYGSGPKPILSLFRTVKNFNAKVVSKFVYRLDISDTSNFSGYLSGKSFDIGFIKVDGLIMGNKVNSLDKLKINWDFYSSGNFLYFFFDKNLEVLNYKKIFFCTNSICINLSDNMDIFDISILGSGGHAIKGINVKNVNIKNVDISEIGGSYLLGFQNGETRFGNGIEFWESAENCVVENCNVSMVYDAAFTMQGESKSSLFKNVIAKKNRFYKNEQNFEFWIRGDVSGFENCQFIENFCYDAGFGWSHKFRPDKDVGVHILNYFFNVSKSDLLITRNEFYNPRSGYIYFSKKLFIKGSKFRTFNNKIVLTKSTPILISPFNQIFINNATSLRKYYNIEKLSNIIYK